MVIALTIFAVLLLIAAVALIASTTLAADYVPTAVDANLLARLT